MAVVGDHEILIELGVDLKLYDLQPWKVEWRVYGARNKGTS